MRLAAYPGSSQIACFVFLTIRIAASGFRDDELSPLPKTRALKLERCDPATKR
jgi:hypothetical protein